jgi:hypothetical protein
MNRSNKRRSNRKAPRQATQAKKANRSSKRGSKGRAPRQATQAKSAAMNRPSKRASNAKARKQATQAKGAAMIRPSKRGSNGQAQRRTTQANDRAAGYPSEKQKSIVAHSLQPGKTCLVVPNWDKWNHIYIRQMDATHVEIILAHRIQKKKKPKMKKLELVRRGDTVLSTPLVDVTRNDYGFTYPPSPDVTLPFPVGGACLPEQSMCNVYLESMIGTQVFRGQPPQSPAETFSFSFPGPGENIPPGNYELRVEGQPHLTMDVTVT